MADTPNEHDSTPNGDQQPQDMPVNQDVDLNDDLGGNDEPTAEPGLVSGRSASVRFNRVESGSSKVSSQLRMDAANQSLADALRITYGFLRVGMVVLLFLFVFSGLQKINEGERGISVFLGKPAKTNLEPGAHLTWPYPIGELIRVGGGAVEVSLARDFMPNSPGTVPDDALLEMPIDRFNNQGRLNPSRAGSLITADLNIAHTQWTVNYHRSDHLKFVKNILPRQERTVIIIAARRGVVQTMAETTIDDLLKQSAESIAGRVRVIAQRTLDDLESGITIDRIVLVRKNPPLYLLNQFASVQSAAQNAGKQREDALLERDQRLNEVAGRAATVLISMIEDYERFIELGETELASQMLTDIDAVFAGEEVNYNGQSTLALISGEVSEMLNQAKSQASTRVSEAIADLEQFRAKQAQFEANPKLMIARDWSSAMAMFLNKDFVTTMYLPEGASAELMINPDPDIERERDRIRRRAEAVAGQVRRRDDYLRDVYKTQRGIQEKEEE
ncbi:MAG: hypothetical protein JKX70_00370 [Phycisphaerales bacterium]|nr:hypothetical protein [Phycisphaerales bacterium]